MISIHRRNLEPVDMSDSFIADEGGGKNTNRLAKALGRFVSKQHC